MTVGDWLTSRLALAPPVLAEQVRAALEENMHRDADAIPQLCITRGESLLRELLQRNPNSRERAGELLLVDALVTYAFEAAIENAQALDDRARDAITRLSALAERVPG